MTQDQLQDKMNEIAAEAKAKGHDLGPGWQDQDVLGTKFPRLECVTCHDTCYLWPDGKVLPMTFPRCPGKVGDHDLLEKE